MPTEVWQRGPVPGYEPLLMPVVHSILQVKEDVDALLSSVPAEVLWMQPRGAASVGFHLRHLAGSSLRLLTYARGQRLSAEQLASAAREGTEQLSGAEVRTELHHAIDRVLEQVRATPVAALLEPRLVGRAALPSTTLGLLFHIAEHATRHAGQAVTTARILAAPSNDMPV
jgi:uncharacterized damage-inducible protein DinB